MTVPTLGGAPAMYNTVDEMEQTIDNYFTSCWEEDWRPVLKDGLIIEWKQQRDRNGQPLMKLRERPTVTGLALALGFNSRQTLLNYQAKKEFMDTVKKAKLIVEHYYEKGVAEGDIHPATGIFILKNFEWKDTFDFSMNATSEQLSASDIRGQLEQRKTLPQPEDQE